MSVELRGARELAARFEVITLHAHEKILERMKSLVARMQERGRATAPIDKGTLRANIVGRVYADTGSRIAGYLSVFDTSGNPRKEYPKAATWEYGTNKIRKIRAAALLSFAGAAGHARLMARVARPMNIAARRYLHGTLEGIQAEAEAEFAAAMDETIAEES